MTSRNEIFGSKFESENFQIYCYADEAGLLSHATIQEVDRTRFAFLVNAPLDVSMQVTGQFSYVFYLDAEPVERKFLPQNYQLVHSEQPRCSHCGGKLRPGVVWIANGWASPCNYPPRHRALQCGLY